MQIENKNNIWCLVGVSAGLLIGAAANLYFNRSLFQKSQVLCQECFSSYPALNTINNFKQFEYKNFRLLLPVIPLAFSLVSTACREKDGAEVAKTLKVMANKKIACAAVAIGLTMIAHKVLYFTRNALDGFDPSGHSMKKICISFALMQSLETRQNLKRSPLEDRIMALFIALVITTDAIQMYNTAAYCHTVAEIAAGVAIAALIQLSATLAVSYFPLK